MSVDSQLAQLNNPGMQPCSATTVGIRVYPMTMSDTCATHVLDDGKSKSCLVQAPAKHASESVLVVG